MWWSVLLFLQMCSDCDCRLNEGRKESKNRKGIKNEESES